MSVELRRVSFSYPRNQVLTDISFRLETGRLGVVMGNNGSGKSTLIKTINRLLKPQTGTVLLDGDDCHDFSRRELARRCGYMPQKSPAINCTVFEAVLLGRQAVTSGFAANRESHLREVDRILKMIHLDQLSDRLTSELSGGELQKVVIARALVQKPRLLLLDEPTNHLDLVNQLEVMALLRKITHELQLTTLVVTHDLNAALRFADHFIFLRRGRLHAAGPSAIITSKLIEEVFRLKSVIADIAGLPVVVPLSA
ncbi:MAG: ABC transporter ATP-binding protein [Deltaproteobacteria bacterium]|nr:ABC transporter ATP-binding protein [Deltaproteobacteria bacterium]